MSKRPLTLGIDPGTIVTGYGLVHPDKGVLDYGCIRPPKKELLSQRYHIIHQAISEIIQKYRPEAVSVETQYVSKNVQSAIKLGMARGMTILAATQHGIPVFEYTPSKAKSAVAGNGQASKEQMQRQMQLLLGLNEIPQPEDAADALALAYCHIQNSLTASPV